MSKKASKLRLFPLVLLCSLMLLGYKLAHIAGVVEALTAVSPAQAEEKPEEKAAANADGKQTVLGQGAKSGGTTTNILGEDPAEKAVLGSLAARREELDRRSKDVDMREQLLAAAQARLDERLAELKSLEAKMNARVAEHDAQNDARVANVVQLYENMKPKDAARIFERLDMGVLIDLARRMSSRKLAPIMSVMDPVVAQDLTVELAAGDKLIDMPVKKDKPKTASVEEPATVEPSAPAPVASSAPAAVAPEAQPAPTPVAAVEAKPETAAAPATPASHQGQPG